jgi:PAS domain S-box-containing protein
MATSPDRPESSHDSTEDSPRQFVAGASQRPSEAVLRALLTSIPDMMFRVRADGTYLEFIPGGGIRPILPPEEFLGKKLIEVMPPDLGSRAMQDVVRALSTKEMQAYEYSLPEEDGVRHYEYRVIPYCDDEVLSMVRDITERKRLEEELRGLNEELEHRVDERTEELVEANRNLQASEQHLAEAQNISHLGNWKWDIPADTVHWSSELYEILGVERKKESPSRAAFLERVHPEDIADVQRAIAQLVSDREPFSIDHRIVLPDGSFRFVHSMARLEYGDDGSPLYLYGTCQDITERKRIEEELRVKDSAIASAISGIGITDIGGRLIYVNDACVNMWGYDSPDEIVGRSLAEFWEGDGALRTVQELHEKGAYLGEDIAKRKDGSLFHVQLSASMIKDEAGKPLYLFGSFVDITERKETEEELRLANLHLMDAYQEIAELKHLVEADNLLLREEIKHEHNYEEIIGESEGLKSALVRLEQVAGTDATVLILGETGTGKELIARAIHSSSPRRDQRLVKVDCAALPPALIESELFGHEKGAFTGASSRRLGRFEIADRGTIFLDEIGDLPLDLQAKLLRVLQDGEFERLGSTKTQKVDVRVIAATNRDLQERKTQGSFRPDLYYRLMVFPIEAPPLRDRKEDVPLLVWHFVTKGQARLGKKIESIPRSLMDRFTEYEWPGNIRELQNVIERALILSPGPTLQVEEPLGMTREPASATRESSSLSVAERAHIEKVLAECGWKVKGRGNAAERLGLNPSTLRTRMKKLGISRP